MSQKLRFSVLCFLVFVVLTEIPQGHSQISTLGKGQAATEKPLDPVLSYSTYLSDVGLPPGTSAVDSVGNVCAVVGSVVTKLLSDGSVVYSRQDSGWAGRVVAIDSQGNCYVAGGGTIVPTPGAFQTNQPPSTQFIMKFNAAGGIVYATYLGGSGSIDDSGLAVDSVGNAYLAGSTSSNDFPTAHALQASFGGGNSDAFVTVLNASGSGLVYSTYLGGSGGDSGLGIAVDSSGNAYITGDTSSPNFPTHSAFQPSLAGTRNAFVIKLDASGNPIYSTFLGSGVTFGTGIAADTSGNAYVVGTADVGFPLVNPLQGSNSFSGFITKLNSSGSTLLYSTYFGFNVFGAKIAVDANQRMFVAGEATTVNSVPTISALQQNFGGGETDGYVSVIDASGTPVMFSTLLGGSGDEAFSSVGVDSDGNIYITGTTDGSFPIVNAENGVFEPFVDCAPHSICGGRTPTQNIALKIAPISGTVLAFPQLVDFRRQPIAVGMSTSPASILVANPSSSNNITISGIVIAGDFSLNNSCPQTLILAAGASCTLSVTFAPTAAGTRTGTITVTDSAPGSPHTINLIGTTVAAQVDVTPSQLSFPSQPLGVRSSSQTITLTNSGGAPLGISRISVAGDFAETNDCGISVAPSMSCQIAVTFTPTVTGNRTGTLTVDDTAEGSPQIIPLSGNGSSNNPGPGLTPQGATSATVTAGQSASYSFSIGGTGTSGTASLSCTGAPAGAICTIPASEPVSPSVATSFSVNVTTTSNTLSAVRLPPSQVFSPWLGMAVLLGTLVSYGTRVRKLPKRRYLWLLLTPLWFLPVSCGGGSTTVGPGPNPNATPAGTYTLTVKAILGSNTDTSLVTLIVR
jgi:hypothetical protein